jgi:TIR domain
MPLAVEPDDLAGISWQASWGQRAFQYDAFLCHNSDDAAALRLRDELRERGATIWYDSDADLRDRRLAGRIGEALFHSRFVILSISEQFRDSMWCRAEYLTGLSTQRLLVAVASPAPPVPAELANVPRFALATAGALDELTRVVRTGNTLSTVFDPHSGDPSPGERQRARAYAESLNAHGGRHPLVERLAIAYLQPEEKPNRELLTAAELLGSADLHDADDDDLAFVRIALRALCNGRHVQNRIWAATLAARMAALPQVTDTFFALLGTATDPAAIRPLATAALALEEAVLASHAAAIERAALRAPLMFSEPAFEQLRTLLSEPVRLRLAVEGGIEFGALTTDERLLLLRQRVDFLLENPERMCGPVTALGRTLRHPLRMTEGELTIYGIDSHVTDAQGNVIDIDETSALALSGMLAEIIAFAERHPDGKPVAALDEYFFPSNLLVPLLALQAHTGARDGAEQAYRAALRIAGRAVLLKEFVPVYESALRRCPIRASASPPGSSTR